MSYIISEEKLIQLQRIHAEIKLILQLTTHVTHKNIELDTESLAGTLFHLEEELHRAISDLPLIKT
jgi:hypothetical protein